jgi:DNA-binding NtrC family response regulator
MPNILLIEDDLIMGESLVDRFEIEGFEVQWCQTIEDAQQVFAVKQFDAVVSDVRLPDGSGERLFQQQLASHPKIPPWLFITAFATVDQAVTMLQLGACNYVTKPFDITALVDKVNAAISKAHAKEPLQRLAFGDDVLGVSLAMRQLATQARRVSVRANTILITGESGAGKEVLARYIHTHANLNKDAPFVAVNCGAIPDNLIEAALFGHERGAFTGADRAHRGYFEQASGGTLFLDEIAELAPAMQVRLLRVLQDRKVQRLGAEKLINLDLKLVFATHADLQEMVKSGRFREDLFYRINVMHLRVPPLRDRPDDVLWLAHRFLHDDAMSRNETPKALTPSAKAALITHHWPGNVRELHNCIERACVLGESPQIDVSDLFEDVTAQEPAIDLPRLDTFVAEAERHYLAAVLSRFDGKTGLAAQALGISRKTLWEKCKRYGLRHAKNNESVAADRNPRPDSAVFSGTQGKGI